MEFLNSLLSGFELGVDADTPVPDLSPDENFLLQMPLSPLGNPNFPQAPILDPARFAGSLGDVNLSQAPPILDTDEFSDPTAGQPSSEFPAAPVSQQTSQTRQTREDPSSSGVRRVLDLLALLTALGGLGGVAQNLLGGGQTATTTPRLSPEQSMLLRAGQGQFGQTGSLLQSLLNAMTTPQIPPALSALVEQSFQPQLGTIATQAIESARRRGFAGGAELLNTGPGGAIAGPPLAALQGQIAAQKLNLYQTNIENLLRALEASRRLASSQGGLATSFPSIKQTVGPKPSILQTIGEFAPILGAVGGVLEPKQKPTGLGMSQVPIP